MSAMFRGRCSLFCVVAFVACSRTRSPSPDAAPRTAEDTIRAFDARRIAIDGELRTLGPGHAWAGDYYYGDGLGANVYVHLAPQAGFVSWIAGCTGGGPRDFGDVVERDGKLELTSRVFRKPEDSLCVGSRLALVNWGERRYLLEPEQMKAFCNEINAGREPRSSNWGNFLMRHEEVARPPTGKPELPREFMSMLLESPLRASIIAVGAARPCTPTSKLNRVCTVTVDVGTRDRAWEGMELYVVQPPLNYRVTINKCTDSTSELECAFGLPSTEPHVGWKLSTRREY